MPPRAKGVLLLAAAIVVAAAVGGLIYSGIRRTPTDASGPKEQDGLLSAPMAKANAPARKLNEKERLLVGKWKFEKVDPPILAPGYEATYEFASDGTFTFRSSSDYAKPWGQQGTYQITGDIIVTRPESGNTAVNLIEVLTEDRFVQSAPDGNQRWVKEWSRIRQE